MHKVLFTFCRCVHNIAGMCMYQLFMYTCNVWTCVCFLLFQIDAGMRTQYREKKKEETNMYLTCISVSVSVRSVFCCRELRMCASTVKDHLVLVLAAGCCLHKWTYDRHRNSPANWKSFVLANETIPDIVARKSCAHSPLITPRMIGCEMVWQPKLFGTAFRILHFHVFLSATIRRRRHHRMHRIHVVYQYVFFRADRVERNIRIIPLAHKQSVYFKWFRLPCVFGVIRGGWLHNAWT